MIDALSLSIARAIKNANEKETSSVEVLKYGISLILNGFFIVFLSLVASFFLNTVVETVITMIAFVFLRQMTGGHHFQSHFACISISTLLMVIIPVIPITHSVNIALTIISTLLILIFAPASLQHQSNIPEKYYPYMKVLATIIVASNLLMGSNILAKTFFVQSVLIIHFKKKEVKKS